MDALIIAILKFLSSIYMEYMLLQGKNANCAIKLLYNHK